MENGPIDLDAFRGLEAQLATEYRRKSLYDRALNGGNSRLVREAANSFQPDERPTDRSQVALTAQYLLMLFAQTEEGKLPGRDVLIAQTLRDLDALEGLSD